MNAGFSWLFTDSGVESTSAEQRYLFRPYWVSYQTCILWCRIHKREITFNLEEINFNPAYHWMDSKVRPIYSDIGFFTRNHAKYLSQKLVIFSPIDPLLLSSNQNRAKHIFRMKTFAFAGVMY